MTISVSRQRAYLTYRYEYTARILEILFLAYVIYSLVSVPMGIYIPYLAGAWLSGLALLSFLSADWKKSARIPMILILAISVSLLFIQFFVHQISLSAPYMWFFVMWVISTMVFFRLSGRPGFVKRMAVVMFLIGLYLRFFMIFQGDVILRQRLDSGSGIDNPNDYAAWMGFVALVFWIWIWSPVNITRRLLLWAFFAVAIYCMLGTVSRGALLSLVVGIIIGLRNIPKRRLLLMVFILGLAFIIFQTFFPNLITNYQGRLSLDTGRLSRWPIAIESLQMQPWWGYNLSRIAHYGAGIDMTPHNGILFLWLSSGVIPSFLFVLLWGIAIFRGYKRMWFADADMSSLPLIVYAFLEMMLSNVFFMSLWTSVALFYCFRESPED